MDFKRQLFYAWRSLRITILSPALASLRRVRLLGGARGERYWNWIDRDGAYTVV
jgi:hypothetical protein